MNGPTIATVATVEQVSEPGWQIVRIADVNGDGKADLVWHHTITGQVTVWLMNGPTIATVATVAQVSDPGWQIVGIADVNGDGKADLVWHHTIRSEERR